MTDEEVRDAIARLRASADAFEAVLRDRAEAERLRESFYGLWCFEIGRRQRAEAMADKLAAALREALSHGSFPFELEFELEKPLAQYKAWRELRDV